MTGDNNNSGGFVTGKDVNRAKHPSIDTADSTSSRFSTESQISRAGPSPGIYKIHIPKDHIYRVPPPENAHRYEYLTKRKANRTSCRRRFCYFIASMFILFVIGSLVAGILYPIYRPQKPEFTVSGVSVAGFNLTSSSPISPVFGTKVRFRNGNSKLGLIYEKGIVAQIFYNGIKLCNGEFTGFKQPAATVTVMETELKGSGIQLTSSSRKELTELQKKGKVPFELRIETPVKFKVGAVTTWTMTVKVDCKFTVDKLTESATVVTENCGTELSLL